ncbi:MAG: L-2-hydroxyglutarate oxidase [Candidatus Phosphoribacter sp.]
MSDSQPALGDESYDYVVVGAGIVGLATAARLLEQRPGARVVVLEKEQHVAAHQTGHNSGVIHAGIYYTPGSLKARLCKSGARATRDFCDEHGIPYRNTGKLIVATDDQELTRMQALNDRALANGLDVERIDGDELRRREPNVIGLGALFLKSTGIVDYRLVCRSLTEVIRARGGMIQLGGAVTGIRETSSEVFVYVGEQRLRTKYLVVCGGIQADRLARMAGLDVGFRMIPFRGEYYRLPEHLNNVVSTLIYPVPDPALPFLGVHLTLMMDGGVTVGPNAVMGLSREGYRRLSVDRRDVADFVRFPGFWKVARAQLRTGVKEQWDSLYKPGYLARIRKYCPSLTLSDLRPEQAGIRAQAVTADGRLVEDFLFEQTARTLHVCNAPSPAATSATPIAEVIVDTLFSATTEARHP